MLRTSYYDGGGQRASGVTGHTRRSSLLLLHSHVHCHPPLLLGCIRTSTSPSLVVTAAVKFDAGRLPCSERCQRRPRMTAKEKRKQAIAEASDRLEQEVIDYVAMIRIID